MTMIEPLEIVPMLCRVAVGGIIFTGATMGIYSLLARQFLRLPIQLPSVDSIRARPLSSVCAVPVLVVTILFTLAAASQSKPAQAPSAIEMVAGALFYSVAMAGTIFGCLAFSKIGFRAAFGLAAGSSTSAVAKGVRYGLEILPLVLLVSMGVSSIGESLGFDMRTQEIFDCLSDPHASGWARAMLIFFAVGIAPVVEEILFRGILLPVVLKGRTFLFGALLTSLYFALMHLHAPSLLSLLVLSVGFSAGYASTGSILTPIAMHAVFNLTGLLLFFAEIK